MGKSLSGNEHEYDERYAGDYMDSDDYSSWAHADLRTRQVVEILRGVSVSPNSVLDYGCGVGGWIPVLERVFKRSKIHGAEISRTAIDKARDKFPDFRFHHIENNLVPIVDESFDLVFSYHVLEHVEDFKGSVEDIARLITNGGYACIIFPCGNPGSFLDSSMNLFEESRGISSTGERPYFFEIPDGHVRRVTSAETIDLFKEFGLEIKEQKFSGHFFGTLDWLCRGTGPAYINRVFSGAPVKNELARIRLELRRSSILGLHRLLQFQHKDLSVKRTLVKQSLLWLLKYSAVFLDRLMVGLSSLEWHLLKNRKNGTAQYLIFEKV